MNAKAAKKTANKTSSVPARRSGLLAKCIVLATGFTAGISTHADSAEPFGTNAPPKTEVIIIGTLHEFHRTNAHFSKEVLRDLIVRCQPTAILVELPPTMKGELTVTNGRLAGGFSKADEGWAEQAAADRLEVPIYPVDMERREEIRQEQGYYWRRRTANQKRKEWIEAHRDDARAAGLKAVQDFDAEVLKSVLCFAQRGTPEIINSEAFDAMIRANHCVGQRIAPLFMNAHSDLAEIAKESAFVGEEWTGRNKLMAENIARIGAQYRGRRMVALAGAEHRYVLRELLNKVPALEVKEFWEVP